MHKIDKRLEHDHDHAVAARPSFPFSKGGGWKDASDPGPSAFTLLGAGAAAESNPQTQP
jgi:hypothetical protein